jgi:hypothetical protein
MIQFRDNVRLCWCWCCCCCCCQAAMDESCKAQLLLERSLRDRQQQLQHKTQEWQGKEQALFTKVTRWCCLVC